MNDYVEPGLYISDSLEESLNTDLIRAKTSVFGNNLAFNNLFRMKTHNIVISEPGFGKSRLLRQIVLSAEEYDKKAIYIDMKSIKNNSIESIINSDIDNVITYNSRNSQKFITENYNFKSINFTLENNSNIIICLDALDEVEAEYFSDNIEKFIKFSRSYEHTTIFVACRSYYLKDISNRVQNQNFSYISLDRFSISKVRQFFLKNDIDNQIADLILDTSYQYGTYSLICVPRYLEILTLLIKKNQIGPDELKSLKRSELFEKFIYEDLEKEDEIKGYKKKEITKRVLEKLALIMEINLSNELTKDELMSFFDDTKSGLTNNFLQQIKIEYLYDRSLLKDNNIYLRFQNTEFQEYLAAKEITRLGNVEQAVFDFAFNNEINEIHPSWFNTLNYLIELKPSLFRSIFEYIHRRSTLIEIDELHTFLTKIYPHDLIDDEKALIFETIVKHYQNGNFYIPIDIATTLAEYYNQKHEEYLKQMFDGRASSGESLKIRRINTCRILKYLLKNNKLDSKYWKRKLLQLTKNNDSDLASASILALAEYKNLDLVINIDKQIQKSRNNDETIDNAITRASIYVDPNSKYTLDKIVHILKNKGHTFNYTLNSITSRDTIINLLNSFINDDSFLLWILEESIYYKEEFDIVFKNIENVWNEVVSNLLKDLTFIIFSKYIPFDKKQSVFVVNLLTLLKNNRPDFTFEIIDFISNSKKSKFTFIDIISVFSIVLESKQLELFITKFEKITGDKTAATKVILTIKDSDRHDANAIYQQAKKYLADEIQHAEKINIDELGQEKRKVQNLYKQFQTMLEPKPSTYVPDVFRFYIIEYKELDKVMKAKDKDRLIYLVKLMLSKVNPSELTVKKKATNNSTTNYEIHGWLKHFGYCIEIANILNINVSHFHKRIISFIPYSDPEELKAIFSLVPNPNKAHIKALVETYEKPENADLQSYKPSSFINACEQYKIQESIPILKEFVKKRELGVYPRTDALNAIARLTSDKGYLEEVFNKYKSSDDNDKQKLRNISNSFLILKYNDMDSIDWRFEQLANSAFPYEDKSGVQQVSNEKEELMHKYFAYPLMELDDPSIIDKYYHLLDKSFAIYAKGKEYHAYTFYLWDIIGMYFENLKIYKHYHYISDLEKEILNKHSNKPGVNWFNEQLKKIKLHYMMEYGKPISITESIKKYNRIKLTTYENINSPEDLLNMVNKVVDTDIYRWVYSEGAYKFLQYISKVSGERVLYEDIIQKTLKTELENAFLRNGLRPNEVGIRRELQLLDDIRPDFQISYGFIQPVVIEVKILENNEVTNTKIRTEYKKKLIKYIKGTKSKYGIYIIFKTQKNDSNYDLDQALIELNDLYEDCPFVTIKGFDCTTSTDANS